MTCFYEADPDTTPIVALKRKFEQLQRQTFDSEAILQMLTTRPEVEAAAILRRIRSSSVASALSMIRDGDLLITRPQPPSVHLSDLPAPNVLTTNHGTRRNRILSTDLVYMDRVLAEPLAMLEDNAVRPEFWNNNTASKSVRVMTCLS